MIRNTIVHRSDPECKTRMAQPTMKPPLPSTPPAAPGNAPPPVVESGALFQGGNELVIRHGGREYRLRRTRFDKLILTA
jgi:hemin uptake protein HemP